MTSALFLSEGVFLLMFEFSSQDQYVLAFAALLRRELVEESKIDTDDLEEESPHLSNISLRLFPSKS